MTREEFEYLQTDQARNLIEQYIECDPLTVALKIRNAAVATQIKNLQKCRTKLPTYYDARCVIPTISYQQSSSEAVASSKEYSGDTALDMTCGLGVDALALSRKFTRVIAVEIDPLRADIARWNFGLLSAKNIEVVCSSAQEYLAHMTEGVDLIYIDPSRRDEGGRSVYAIENCQPDVLQMLPQLRAKSREVLIKLSPLFDVEQAYRLFGDDVRCSVITLENECKEVVVEISPTPMADICLVAIIDAKVHRFCYPKHRIGDFCSTPIFNPLYICVPDIAFYKARMIGAAMQGHTRYCYTGGYILTETLPESFCGATYSIEEVMPYQPKVLRKRFKKAILHIRDFPYTMEQIGIRQGGGIHLFCTMHDGVPTVFRARCFMSNKG